MHKDTKFCYSSFDISTFGFKAPPYCTFLQVKQRVTIVKFGFIPKVIDTRRGGRFNLGEN